MTSQKQINANRCNAQKSSGPKSKNGKNKSKSNSLKHGLASAIIVGSPEDLEIKNIASAIVDVPISNLEALIYAREAAEAEYNISRIKTLKAEFFNKLEVAPCENSKFLDQFGKPPRSSSTIEQLIRKCENIYRYEQRAQSRRKKALHRLLGVN